MTETGKGKFIAVEGVDGAGKGVQSRLLLATLQQRGIDALLTREPGGSPGAEQIRELLVKGDADKWDALSELLLINAARRNHLLETIWPALRAGRWVICDRFADSTRAFQGYAGGIDLALINLLHEHVTGNCTPDLTLVLDLSPEQSLRRTETRGDAEDRFEKKGIEYQDKVRSGFLQLAQASPATHVLIDAAGSVEEVAQRMIQAVTERLAS